MPIVKSDLFLSQITPQQLVKLLIDILPNVNFIGHHINIAGISSKKIVFSNFTMPKTKRTL